MRDLQALASKALAAAMTVALPWAALGAEPQGLEALEQGCAKARSSGDLKQLRLTQRQLLEVYPAPQPLPVVLANADVLLRCGAPDSALVVLRRYSPAPGPEQMQWLLMQWRAANQALDHRLAAQALRQLVVASGQTLEQLDVPVALQPSGRWQTAAALDLLAGHLEAMGATAEAVQVLLASRRPGTLTAQRLAHAMQLAATLPLDTRLSWLESALQQAAAAGAWGLAQNLLDQQLALLADHPGERRNRVEQRRRKLAGRIDDAAGLHPESVRSPHDPGGHAAAPQP